MRALTLLFLGLVAHARGHFHSLSRDEAARAFDQDVAQSRVPHSHSKKVRHGHFRKQDEDAPTPAPASSAAGKRSKPCKEDDDVDDSPDCDDDVASKSTLQIESPDALFAAQHPKHTMTDAQKHIFAQKQKEEKAADLEAAEAAGYHKLPDGSWVKNSKPTPSPTQGWPTYTPTSAPTEGCAQKDIFAFCASDMQATYSMWYSLHKGKAYTRGKRIDPVSPGCAETGMYEKAMSCRIQPGEAVYWLNEATSDKERDAKQTELLYECYECVFGHVPYFWKHANQPFLASCASPQFVIPPTARENEFEEKTHAEQKETRCEMRCAEKLALKFKNEAIMTPLCQAWKKGDSGRRLDEAANFADLWNKKEKKLLRKEHPPTSAPTMPHAQHSHSAFYEVPSCHKSCTHPKCKAVCDCMTECQGEQDMISCIATPQGYNGDSLAERALLSSYAGMCCDSISDLIDNTKIAVVPSNTYIFGDPDFDYSLYVEQTVCEWTSQLKTHNNLCQDEHDHMLKYNKLRADKCPHAHSLPPTPAPTVTDPPTPSPTPPPSTPPPNAPPTPHPTPPPTVNKHATKLANFIANSHFFDNSKAKRPLDTCQMPTKYRAKCRNTGGCCVKLSCVQGGRKGNDDGICYKVPEAQKKAHKHYLKGHKSKRKSGCKYDDDYDDGSNTDCDDDQHVDDDA